MEKEIHEQNSPIKMSLVWVSFYRMACHDRVTDKSSLGNTDFLDDTGFNSCASFLMHCCSHIDVSNTGCKMHKGHWVSDIIPNTSVFNSGLSLIHI